VVVVVPEDLHDSTGAGKAGVRAYEDQHGAGGDETVHQILGQAMVDLSGDARWSLAPVGARVVNINVEAVLVRDMTRTEGASVAAAEIADT
jgi:hypothetical protein